MRKPDQFDIFRMQRAYSVVCDICGNHVCWVNTEHEIENLYCNDCRAIGILAGYVAERRTK